MWQAIISRQANDKVVKDELTVGGLSLLLRMIEIYDPADILEINIYNIGGCVVREGGKNGK